MKEQLPSPEFNRGQYTRPNDNWICGRAADGECCPLGPDARGRCRAGAECQPSLELKPGDQKGRWKCTRSKEHGGPCELGPLPDGSCCRQIPKCSPVRSLRSKRGVFTISFTALTVGVLLICLSGPLRLKIISPGDLSRQHSAITFAKTRHTKIQQQDTCETCHGAAKVGPAGWLQSAFMAEPNPLQWKKLVSVSKTAMTKIDDSCQRCHDHHKFHEPNVVRDHSCSACHREHQGGGRMKFPDDSNCVSCHGDAAVMQSSFEKGKTIRSHEFDYRADLGRVLFKAPRPERGYTQVFHSFADDHPEFQFHRDNLRDPNTLKFNHSRHFQSDIPKISGKQLDCAFCHKPDAAGTYHQKISYEANCKVCHALQFDAENPDLTVPHGNATGVRAFLRSLPQQYSDLARHHGLTSNRETEKFVREQMTRIRAHVRDGEDLEKQIFLSNEKWAPAADIAHSGAQGPAKFPGCVRCHDVHEAGEDAPAVTKPIIADRWLIRGNFNHAKHLNMDCENCHKVRQSHDTADILLPEKVVCASCHSPEGGVSSSCATCHSYHVKGEWLTTTR